MPSDPLSYFRICCRLTPMRRLSSLCDICNLVLRSLILAPTSTSASAVRGRPSFFLAIPSHRVR